MPDRILLIDDEAHVLDAYRRSLRNRYPLDVASSAEEAVMLIEARGPYAVVVTDLCMPGMDGMELLARLNQARPHIMRIMITGKADLGTAIDAVNRGQAFRFLEKPCPPETLIQAIDDALDSYQQRHGQGTQS